MLSVMNSMPSTLGLLILVIVIGVVIIIPLWIRGYFQVMGPIIGALISIIAVLGNETAKYYSSTSTLKLSLGLGNEKNSETTDPGLDVEVFKDPPDYRRYRVSAMVINNGKAIIRDVKASLTIKVCEHKQNMDNKPQKCRGDYYLGKVLDKDNYPYCKRFLVNEHNPHVIGEVLPWALPERTTIALSTSIRAVDVVKDLFDIDIEKLIGCIGNLIDIIKNKLDFNIDAECLAGLINMINNVKFNEIPWPLAMHITSISPGQRSRLLIFEYVRLSDGEYLVMPFSHHGSLGLYRACLRLDKDHEFVFEVTAHGEGARSPLQFKLCIDSEKLANIENAIGDFEKLLKALNNLKKCEN